MKAGLQEAGESRSRRLRGRGGVAFPGRGFRAVLASAQTPWVGGGAACVGAGTAAASGLTWRFPVSGCEELRDWGATGRALRPSTAAAAAV